MSVDCYDCESWQVEPQERRQRARKEHRCDACCETIRRGDIYIYEFSVFDGNAESLRRCLRCDTIYQHLIDRHRGMEDSEVDRELRCGHTYREVFEQEPSDEIAQLAFLTADEAQAKFGRVRPPEES